ncbi:WD40 repeat-like protein [Panus rudis PR-1116 ss-1]|nr:WD40 repeat-like protein [Panus rudis PR-1116 ss-1]
MSTATDKGNFLRAEAELALDAARKAKAERTKHLGEPIQLAGVALDIQVRGNHAWIAENTSLVKKISLETGKTLQVFRGHSAPVTVLAFYDKVPGSGDGGILITGSWDKNINVWDIESKQLISSTPAHSDFIKSLLVIPSLKLLASGSSDKIVRFWDLSSIEKDKTLTSIGSISAHTRPVVSLDARTSDSPNTSSVILYTADSMGLIKAWEISREEVQDASSHKPPRFRAIQVDELKHHRTGVNEMKYGNGQLWTASLDETVQVLEHPPVTSTPNSNQTKPIPPISHPTAVKALLPLSLTPLSEPYLLTGSGDVIRVYDVSSPEEPELLHEVDAHWHDVSALRLWVRKTTMEDGKVMVEPWIVSASLDGTIRKWRLADLLQPPPPVKPVEKTAVPQTGGQTESGLTEEEERELAELMGED